MPWASQSARPGPSPRPAAQPIRSRQQPDHGHAAALSFDEAHIGSITPGKRADLVIRTENPDRVRPDELPRLAVAVTMVDGEVVYP
jgi:cytosine/adenosine deaminase-related metal-dependent hydrolase